MLPTIRKTCLAAAMTALAVAMPVRADGIIEEPLPRFEDRVCPGILGLEREYAELVVTRLRTNAESFGLRLASHDSCEPNLVVAIVEDSRTYLADLMERRAYLFVDMEPAERQDMLAQANASGVWHQIAPRTRDGIRVGRSDNLVQPPRAGMWQAHSRIYRPVRHDITYALVLLNKDAVSGLTLRQIADFATLRALATEYPEVAQESADTMLRLFDEGASRPQELTAVDRAWLTRLYHGIPNLPASSRLRGLEVAGND